MYLPLCQLCYQKRTFEREEKPKVCFMHQVKMLQNSPISSCFSQQKRTSNSAINGCFVPLGANESKQPWDLETSITPNIRFVFFNGKNNSKLDAKQTPGTQCGKNKKYVLNSLTPLY